MNNTQENPIIIVDKKGSELIQQLIDLALRGAGINAYTTVNNILQQTKSYTQFITESEKEKNLKGKKK